MNAVNGLSGPVKVVTEQCILFLVRLMQWSSSTDLTNMTNVDGKNVNGTQCKKIKTLLTSEHTTTTDGKDL